MSSTVAPPGSEHGAGHGQHGDHGDHPEWFQHHFHDSEQQYISAKLGMWAFLGQEILFFGGLFMAYGALRFYYPETFLAAHEFLDWKMGALNTIALLTSSLTMALAVRAAQLGKKGQMQIQLAATFALAGVFCVIKYLEYSHKFHDCLFPGRYFGSPIPDPTAPGEMMLNPACEAAIAMVDAGAKEPGMFFGLYFTMTGLHALHVIVGMGLIAWIMVKGKKNAYSPQYYTPVENVGLYWHLVDLIWIFLFPLLYLVR